MSSSLGRISFELDLGTYWHPTTKCYVSPSVHTGGKLAKGEVRWVVRLHTFLSQGFPPLNYVVQLKPDPVCDSATIRKLVNKYLSLEGYVRIYPHGDDKNC